MDIQSSNISFARKYLSYVSYIDPIDYHRTEDVAIIMEPRKNYVPAKIDKDIDTTIIANNNQNEEIFKTGITDIFAKTNESITKDQKQAEKEALERKQRLLAMEKEKAKQKEKLEYYRGLPHMKELLGHTLPEVLVGAVIGIVVAIIVWRLIP